MTLLSVDNPAYKEALEERERASTLNGGGGGAKFNGMDSELIDAKVAAAEARVDTEFAKLRGELQRLPGKGTVWAAAGSLFLGVLAILSFGGDRLALGLGQADARQAQLQRDAKQDAASAELRASMKIILAKLDQPRPQK